MNRSGSPHEGLAVLSYGFRPLFLLAGIFAVLSVGLWLPEYEGEISIPTTFSPVSWHAHEMLYGYLVAAVSGFLLTAIPNWTGRLPFQGRPLALLVGLWLAGRIAIAISAHIGWVLAMLVDCSFLLAFVGVTSREVLAGSNFRNLKVVALVSVLLIGNLTFHLEAHRSENADYGIRIGIAGMMMLVMVIGGRIIPSFTRNWLARQTDGRMPIGFNRFDVAAIGISAVALLVWVVSPVAQTTDTLLFAAGLAQLVRLARWAGERTWRDRLVLVLHIAYLFVPVGFLLLAASDKFGVPPSAGIHAWTIGAMATCDACRHDARDARTYRQTAQCEQRDAIYLWLNRCCRFVAHRCDLSTSRKPTCYCISRRWHGFWPSSCSRRSMARCCCSAKSSDGGRSCRREGWLGETYDVGSSINRCGRAKASSCSLRSMTISRPRMRTP